MENSVFDFRFEPFPPDFHPETISRAGFHLKYSEFGKAIRLSEVNTRQFRAESVEGALIHSFGAVRDDTKCRIGIFLEDTGEKHHTKKSWSRREKLDRVPHHVRRNCFRRTFRGNDRNTAVEERMKQRVDATRVIEEKK